MAHPDMIMYLAAAHQLDLLDQAANARLAALAAENQRESSRLARWLLSRIPVWSTPQRTLRSTGPRQVNPPYPSGRVIPLPGR